MISWKSEKKLTITCPLGMSNMTSVFFVDVDVGFFCRFLTSFEFVCPSMIVLLHIIWSICICQWYTHITDCYTSLTDCRHLNNDTIRALHLAVIRCAGLAFTCGVKMMWLCHVWGWQPPQTASYIHIRRIQSDWAHWYAIHGHTVSTLHSYTLLLGSYFGVLGHLWSQNDKIMSWLRLMATSNCFPYPY